MKLVRLDDGCTAVCIIFIYFTENNRTEDDDLIYSNRIEDGENSEKDLHRIHTAIQ